LSLANWISITRAGIELEPGESHDIDIRIDVNLKAKPGVYHAAIAFPSGSARYEAEARVVGAPTLTLNIEVKEDIKENLQLGTFRTKHSFNLKLPVNFEYELENIGNRPLIPRGEILIYDRNGREVAAFPVNAEGVAVETDGKNTFVNEWAQGEGQFGRYKAFLSLEFGETRDGKMQDTIFFWVVPWYAIIVILMAIIGIVLLTASLIHRRYEMWHHERVAALVRTSAHETPAPPRGAQKQRPGRVVDLRNKERMNGIK